MVISGIMLLLLLGQPRKQRYPRYPSNVNEFISGQSMVHSVPTKISPLSANSVITTATVTARKAVPKNDNEEFSSSTPPPSSVPRNQNHQDLFLNQKSPSSLPPPNKNFTEMLIKLGLQDILVPVSDLGYFGWRPKGPYRSLDTVSANEIREGVDLTSTPKPMKDLQHLQQFLPLSFHWQKPILLVENRYPHGQTSIASLYVASRFRGVDFQKHNVKFLFGSYTMFFLAMGQALSEADLDMGERIIVARVPGYPNIVLATRYMLYTDNLSANGPRLERFIVSGKLDDEQNPPSASELEEYLTSTDHLQLIRIGTHTTVLLSGEVDALDPITGYATEIKMAPIPKRRYKTLLQMISNGSLQLCHGYLKYQGYDKRRFATMMRLKIQTANAFRCRMNISRSEMRQIGRSIERRVRWLSRLCDEKLQEGQVKQIVFLNNDDNALGMDLIPALNVTINDLFPNKSVIEELLG